MNSALRCPAEVNAVISSTFVESVLMNAALKDRSLSKTSTAATLGASVVQTLFAKGTEDTVVPGAFKKAKNSAIGLNSEIVTVEGASHCLDIEVKDLVAARFIRLIPDGQLGKPASAITLVRGR